MMTNTSSRPDVTIIIVNWNVSDLLDSCLTTLKKHTTSVSYEVIVVDNNSPDDSVSMVKKKHPWVHLIDRKDNLGFAKGNNFALNEAKGKHILYLNPDVDLIEDAIGPMYAYLEAHPDVGIIGCKLLNSDKTHQSSIGHFTRFSNLVREYFFREKADRIHITHPNTPTEVDVVLGACMLVRGDIVRQIGGFDDRYFMYHEETDMCLAFKTLGYKTIYFPTVAMIHHGSRSSTKTPEQRQRTLHENRKSQYLFFRKHYGVWVAQGAKILIAMAMLSRLPLLWMQTILKPQSRPYTHPKLHYYWQTVRWLVSHF